MFYDAIKNKHGLKHDPFKALVSPRPIGWISSVSADGVLNLAPYSFFNALSSNPHFVMFSSDGWKDSVANIQATGEFVCSVVSYELRDQMNMTSQGVEPEVSEFELAGLTPEPSHFVKPPRVKEAPAALECKYHQTVELPGRDPDSEGAFVVIGQVVGVYIDEQFIEGGMVDVTRFQPLARLGYMDYSRVEDVFAVKRPGGSR